MGLKPLPVPVRRAVLWCGFVALFCSGWRASLAAQAPQPQRTLFAEAAFDSGQGFVQAQSIYRIRFFQSVSFSGFDIKPPRLPTAEIQSIGGDLVSEVQRGETRYRVTERRYAVFPFASGELQVDGLQVSGHDATGGAARAVQVPVPSARLLVRPIPLQVAPAAWLPARQLRLVEQWTPATELARQGEALRWTLRIEATGVDAARIVAPNIVGEGFSAHPEPPRLSNRFEKGWNLGIREQVWRLVPARPGKLVVPELRIAWWNVIDDELSAATLPARTLVVGAGATVADDSFNAGKADTDATRLSGAKHWAFSDLRRPNFGLLLTAAACCLIAAAAVAWWWQSTAAWRALRTACRRNDAKAARQALLIWSRQRFPKAAPGSLGEVEQQLSNGAARAAVRALDRSLYGPPGSGWAGRLLLQALRQRDRHSGG